MTKKEVRALYPKGRTQLTESCYAVISPQFDKDGLSEVGLAYAIIDKIFGCPDIVANSLLAKYGPPEKREDQVQVDPCLNPYSRGVGGFLGQLCEATGGDDPKHHVYLSWIRDGILINFKSTVGDNIVWRMAYKPLPNAPTETTDKL